MRFMDPTMQYGIALAQTAGRVVLRVASADVLPFDFEHFSATVGRYVKEVEELADKMREETEEHNRAIDDDLFDAAADPTETWVTPKRLDPVPHLNFAPLDNARDRLPKSAHAYQPAPDRADPDARGLAPQARRARDPALL